MAPDLTEYIESRLEGKFQLEINRDKTRIVDLRACTVGDLRSSTNPDLERAKLEVLKRHPIGEGDREGTGEATRL